VPSYPSSPVRARETLLISRATWGWTPQTEADVLRSGWPSWLDRQLAPSTISDATVDTALAGYTALRNTNQQNWATVDATDDGWDHVVYQLLHGTLRRQVKSNRQLFEVMVDFWNNHFNVFLLGSGKYAHLKVTDDRTVARTHALGRFEDLLVASARSPAMLVYLDNFRNDVSSPGGLNENYGRELLELHTLGIVDGNQVYGEADVAAATRVLSGWSIDEAARKDTFLYKAGHHHTGPISFLGGTWSTPGRTGALGERDGIAFLRFLAGHRSTAEHLAWKLCRRFVSDSPPPALVQQLADVYQANDTAIAPVLRTLFHSQAFADSAGQKVRRGLEVAVAALRIVDAQLPTDPTSDLTSWIHAEWGILAGLGQQIFGHRFPDGYPDENAHWISADGFLRRWETCGWIAKSWLGEDYSVDPRAMLPDPVPRTGGAVVDALARRLSGKVLGSPHHGFPDVPAASYFDQSVSWMLDKQITTGYVDGRFKPSNNLNRGQLATFLWRLVGKPTGMPPTRFPDVPASAYFFDAVSWMVHEGITTGYVDGTFKPNNVVNRGQLATFLWRLEGEPGGSPRTTFPDVKPSAYYHDAVSWMVFRGITTGYVDGTFKPNNPVNRAQISAFLWRLAFSPEPVISATERNALLVFLGCGEHQVVEDWLLWKTGDLNSLLLGFPAFQRK
jgi:uncharacterized protein (DUF1800 family)